MTTFKKLVSLTVLSLCLSYTASTLGETNHCIEQTITNDQNAGLLREAILINDTRITWRCRNCAHDNKEESKKCELCGRTRDVYE